MSKLSQKENILVVIKKANGDIKQIKGHNLVTADGEEYYARLVIGEASNITTPFYLRLGSSTDAPTSDDTDVTTYIDNTALVVDDGFPKRNYTNDNNSDGGVNVITYKISYDLGGLDVTGVSEGALTDDDSSPSKALNHWLFDQTFDVTTDDQLTVFINHSFVGV